MKFIIKNKYTYEIEITLIDFDPIFGSEFSNSTNAYYQQKR